jgi:hypothetical protein
MFSTYRPHLIHMSSTSYPHDIHMSSISSTDKRNKRETINDFEIFFLIKDTGQADSKNRFLVIDVI